MHQPYTAPTLTSTRPATGFHTSPRQSSIHKPIHQRTTLSTHHKYHHTHSTNTTPIQPPQTHTASTPTQTHSTQGRPDVDVDVDADALDVDAVAPTLQPDAVAARQSAIGQARQTGTRTRQDRIRPKTIQAGLDQTTGQVSDSQNNQTGRPYRIRPGPGSDH